MECTLPSTYSKFKTKPYRHQLDCLNKFGQRPYFALLAEMGTGKSWIIINNLADLWASNDCYGALILAPNGVHLNWILNEIPAHMPDWVQHVAVAWNARATKNERFALSQILENQGEKLRILTMNHEALQTKKGYEFAVKFLQSVALPMLAVDESDAYKTPSAIRTKNLMHLKRYAKWRRILSGTPVNNAPFDLFSQFGFLDEHILGTSSFYAFKAEYSELIDENSSLAYAIRRRSGSARLPQIVARDAYGRPKYKNLDKLNSLIAPYSYRVLKQDCLDLPSKIYKTLYFDLTAEQKKHYLMADEECRLVFEGDATPFNKLVAVTKLAQITSGYYIHPLSDGEPVRIAGDNPKLALLLDRVKAIVQGGGKVIVWARYRIEIADICNALADCGIEFVEYHGGINTDDRTKNLDAFQNGTAKVFVGNQQAGGTGITLTAANYVIYFSNSFSLRDRLQSEDRAHRIGQKNNVTYINIAARNTIDEIVVKALLSKKNVADCILAREKW